MGSGAILRRSCFRKEVIMTDKKKIEILLETNKQLQEEKKGLQIENDELRLKLDGNAASNKLVRRYKKEQQKIIDDLRKLKRQYEKELTDIRKTKRDYMKLSKKFLSKEY